MTYKVVRKFESGKPEQIVKENLTLEEAQAYCQDPETSSKTATNPEALAFTEKYGNWAMFYYEEGLRRYDKNMSLSRSLASIYGQGIKGHRNYQ